MGGVRLLKRGDSPQPHIVPKGSILRRLSSQISDKSPVLHDRNPAESLAIHEKWGFFNRHYLSFGKDMNYATPFIYQETGQSQRL